MSAAPKRQDAGAAVAGLFARPTATGGLAGRDRSSTDPPRQPEHAPSSGGTSADARLPHRQPRMRLGVELTERELGFLRALSRPVNTGQPRTLGAKFVAAGLLAAAIELLADVDVDMCGVRAGDLPAMSARARDALIQAGSLAEVEEGET